MDDDFINGRWLSLAQVTVPAGCCPGCGSKFQSSDENSPGFLDSEKLEDLSGAKVKGEVRK